MKCKQVCDLVMILKDQQQAKFEIIVEMPFMINIHMQISKLCETLIDKYGDHLRKDCDYCQINIARLHEFALQGHGLRCYVLDFLLEVCNSWIVFINQLQAIRTGFQEGFHY